MTNPSQGNLFIVAAPSGGGKTSLVKTLLDSLSNIEVSISHTTRPMRIGERDGIDYFFIGKDQFIQLIAENAFVEHAMVFEHYYGTSVAQIQSRLALGIDVVLDIDWQGARQIRSVFPDAVSVFVLPPSLEVLTQRLQTRGRDDENIIASRMAKAREEMDHYSEFDYLIINDNFDQAAEQLRSIVIANRVSLSRQITFQAKLLSFLCTPK